MFIAHLWLNNLVINDSCLHSSEPANHRRLLQVRVPFSTCRCSLTEQVGIWQWLEGWKAQLLSAFDMCLSTKKSVLIKKQWNFADWWYLRIQTLILHPWISHFSRRFQDFYITPSPFSVRVASPWSGWWWFVVSHQSPAGWCRSRRRPPENRICLARLRRFMGPAISWGLW